jgi:cytochrome P450
LQRDPRYFSPLPNHFLPDRWLSAEERTSVGSSLKSSDIVLNTDAFMPFSFGPANCVGKALATVELRMVICTLMQRFEMRFARGWDPVQYEKAFLVNFLPKKRELPVLLTPRNAD